MSMETAQKVFPNLEGISTVIFVLLYQTRIVHFQATVDSNMVPSLIFLGHQESVPVTRLTFWHFCKQEREYWVSICKWFLMFDCAQVRDVNVLNCVFVNQQNVVEAYANENIKLYV